jgi:hypothetical protein
LTLGSPLSARWVLGGGVQQCCIDLGRDVAFQAARDVPVGESLGSTADM